MSLTLRQIVIPTAHKDRWPLVLAELMEAKLEVVDDARVLVLANDVRLLFVPSQRSSGRVIDTVMIDFWVESRQELDDLVQRWEFVQYRFGLKLEGRPTITNTDAASYFVLPDLDGRKWKFSCMNAAR